MDVMRLPSLANHYNPNGSTALIDGMLTAISDLELTPQLYADHAFLVYGITDGFENCSIRPSQHLRDKICSLKDNWTVAVLVPDQIGVFESKKLGIPKDNYSTWNSNDSRGITDVGSRVRKSNNAFFEARSSG